MNLFKRLLLSLTLLLLIGGVVQAQDGPLPQHDGELSVVGLTDSVEVLRDEWGVPHIYASNLYDLFFAQGFTQAQDRWWQMEFFRHIGSGAIQELTGRNEDLLGTDLYLRTLGFREVAAHELEQNYAGELASYMQAFADGVNAYITSREPTGLALEYGLLQLSGVTVEVEPWTPVDSLVWAKMMAQDLSGNESTERLFSRLYAAGFDEDMLNDWQVEWAYGEKPTIVAPEDLPITDTSLETSFRSQLGVGIVGLETRLTGNFELDDLLALGLPADSGIGSNNWVAHGDITETGLPLMANDMHLGIQMPSIWYEIGLHCMPVTEDCPMDVVGFALSPSPAIIAGHNANISWALTNTNADTQDLYQIRVNPDNPLQYEYNGEWRDMTVREETLNFGDGSEPITFQVRETHFGPIMNDNQLNDDGTLSGFNNENPVAMRWTALEPGTLFRGVLGVNMASNWSEFREALRDWDVPSQNIIYADVEGNIGYQLPGNFPIRAADHTGLLPVPGWTDEYEWRGYIPYDALPRVLNPERDYIATANQAIVPLEYYDQLVDAIGGEFGADSNYEIGRFYNDGYRGQRINELLVELVPHSVQTFQQMHADSLDISARELLPIFGELEIEDAELAEVRDWLLEWDYRATAESAQATLWYQVWVRLTDNLWNDELEGLSASDGSDWWATMLLLSQPNNVWWDDTSTADITETRDDVLLRSLEEAYAATVETLGEDREAWAWGDLHTVTFISNPLGQSGIAPVERRVNRGPFPVSATTNAINAMTWRLENFTIRNGPSQRAIYDASNWDNSVSIHTTGQSGHPDSEHYDDMIEPWINIEYRPMVFSREAVEAAAVNTLVLTPGN
ncbi:MAG: penicillin acylase family protein [bacterium]|nr:penicillin acylase family protein [bacterium]